MHGARLAKLTREKSGKIAHEAEDVIRRTLVKVLLDNSLKSVFSGKKRDDYLDQLAFGRPIDDFANEIDSSAD